ncbi:hypothetical protein pb186bvf_015517 [Paramecium bursaria]
MYIFLKDAFAFYGRGKIKLIRNQTEIHLDKKQNGLQINVMHYSCFINLTKIYNAKRRGQYMNDIFLQSQSIRKDPIQAPQEKRRQATIQPQNPKQPNQIQKVSDPIPTEQKQENKQIIKNSPFSAQPQQQYQDQPKQQIIQETPKVQQQPQQVVKQPQRRGPPPPPRGRNFIFTNNIYLKIQNISIDIYIQISYFIMISIFIY